MLGFQDHQTYWEGPHGRLAIPDGDDITRKIAMLIEGECEGLGPTAAARKFGYSKQRHFQLRRGFLAQGSRAPAHQPRGPRAPSRRTDAVVRQVIRYRFLDPGASVPVIAQKLRQDGWTISQRSVERILTEFGLPKKTPPVSSGGAPR